MSVALKTRPEPIKVKVTRIEEIFEETNPYAITPYKIDINSNQGIIKDYIYSSEKIFLSE